MKERLKKRDAGTIFNPQLYLALLIVAAQLMMLFIGYKRIQWLSEIVTNSMTDALLGACTLNEDELYQYGKTDELVVTNPREKYELFKGILREELGLNSNMEAVTGSVPYIEGKIAISDFRVYSVNGSNITLYDFDESGGCTTSELNNMTGVLTLENGEVIEHTSMLARLKFKVKFLGKSVEVEKYHMVDMTK